MLILLDEALKSLLPLLESAAAILLLRHENVVRFEDNRSNLIACDLRVTQIGTRAVRLGLAVPALLEPINMTSALTVAAARAGRRRRIVR